MQALQRLNPNLMLRWILYGYFFISAIPHTSAARYILLGLFLVALCAALVKKTVSLAPNSAISWALTTFVTIALISATTSPYIADSLQGFRKDYLPPLLMVLAAGGMRMSDETRIKFVQGIIIAIVCGFAVKTSLAFWDGAINHPFIFSPYSNPDFFAAQGLPKYVAFYAVESTLYLAIALGFLLFIRCNRWLSLAIASAVAVSYFIIFVSGIRAAFLVTLVLLGLSFFALLIGRKSRSLAALACGIFIVGGVSYFVANQNTEIDRFASVFKPDSYSQAQGMSGRYQTWSGIIELSEFRPVLGFGPGWQKLPDVAQDVGLTEKWRKDQTDYGRLKYTLLSLKRGQVNPHNLAMQLLFETGVLGLAAYTTLIFLMIIGTYRLCKSNNPPASFAKSISLISSAYLLAYLMVEVTNGFLLHNTFVALMIILNASFPTVISNRS